MAGEGGCFLLQKSSSRDSGSVRSTAVPKPTLGTSFASAPVWAHLSSADPRNWEGKDSPPFGKYCLRVSAGSDGKQMPLSSKVKVFVCYPTCEDQDIFLFRFLKMEAEFIFLLLNWMLPFPNSFSLLLHCLRASEFPVCAFFVAKIQKHC